MAESLLDGSALLASLRKEPGAEKAEAVLAQACTSAVNMAETIGKPL